MKEPVDHVRRSTLPWRHDEGLTECGLPAASYPTLGRAEFLARCRDYGKQRTAITTCMTCLNRFETYWRLAGGAVDGDVVADIDREIHRGRNDENSTLRLELEAIAALIEAHRDEFDAYLAGRAETTDLADVRRRRRHTAGRSRP